MLRSLKIHARRLGNRLIRCCPNGDFEAWKMKHRIRQAGGAVSRKANSHVIVGTLSDGGQVAFRESTTDALILYEVLWKHQYQHLSSICTEIGFEPTTILDGGANIGAFTLVAKKMFPNCKMVCVEPDSENCEVLQLNIEKNSLSQCVVVNGAVWSSDRDLFLGEGFRENRERELSFSVGENETSGGRGTNGYCLETLSQKFAGRDFDVVKLDIEGAEAELLAHQDQIARLFETTRILVIEIHDEVFDRMRFHQQVHSLGLNTLSDGELTYVWS